MSPLVAVLNTDCPWQSKGSLRSDFFRTGKSCLFSGLPGRCPERDGADPAWRTRSRRAGNSRMARHEHLERINTSPSKSLEGERTKQAREKQGRTKWCWWEKAFQLLGKGAGMAEQGCWAGGSLAHVFSSFLTLVLSSSVSFPHSRLYPIPL